MTATSGLHHNISAAEYHADPCDTPSLSSSIAHLLLSDTPAKARNAHPRLNPSWTPEKSTKQMNLGSLAHELLLGSGGGFEVAPFDAYTTKAAREWRDDVIMRGLMPVKPAEHRAASCMVATILAHVERVPGAERAFRDGHAESVVIWYDSIGCTLCRAMIDWIDIERTAIYDLKTTGRGLSDYALQRKIAEGLDLQAAFYLHGVEHLWSVSRPIAWRWVFVEDEEPFAVRIIEMDGTTRAFGDRKAAAAINIWQRCLTENHWPGFPAKIERLPYPGWAEAAWLAREAGEDAHERN